MSLEFDSVTDVVDEIKKGNLVIVVDSKNRENEGDFIGAASKVNSETINFMLNYARGAFIAVFMPYGKSDELGISPMIKENTSFNETKFRVSVDAASCKSGSSAQERASTVNLLGSENSKDIDFVQPGHVVPIEASPGELFSREGHTEAGVTLVKLAGFNPPVAVDLEILNEDGTMAEETRLFYLAKKFGIKIIDIYSIIKHLKLIEKQD